MIEVSDLSAATSQLSWREIYALKARHRVDPLSYAEMAGPMGMTRQGAHATYLTALSKLRHPCLGLQSEGWRSRAACRGMPLRHFFQKGRNRTPPGTCDECPVAFECCTFAIDNKIPRGIWGHVGRKGRDPLPWMLRQSPRRLVVSAAMKRTAMEELLTITDPEQRLRAALAAKQRAMDDTAAELAAELAGLRKVVADAIAAAKADGISQSELARRLGVSRQRLSQLAHGAD